MNERPCICGMCRTCRYWDGSPYEDECGMCLTCGEYGYYDCKEFNCYRYVTEDIIYEVEKNMIKFNLVMNELVFLFNNKSLN